MTKLRFKAADVRRVVEHSLAAPKQADVAYTGGGWGVPAQQPDGPAVILVHDDGVYLMSNGEPGDLLDPTEPRRHVAYAEGCDPKANADWWDTSRDLVGGDDFAETLPWAAQIKAAIDGGAKFVTLNYGRNNISLDLPLPDQTEPLREAWRQNAAALRLDPAWLGRRMTVRGLGYTIVGLAEGKVALQRGRKCFLAQAEIVRNLLIRTTA